MWSERVLHPEDDTDRAINAFNEYVRYDQRVQRVMLTIKDGVTIARKR
jgi:caffeoyl-CoA O-methyltransferase